MSVGSLFGVVGMMSKRQLGTHVMLLALIAGVVFFTAPRKQPARVVLALPPSKYYYGPYYGEIAARFRKQVCTPKKEKLTFGAFLTIFTMIAILEHLPYRRLVDIAVRFFIWGCAFIIICMLDLRKAII
ncbi:hypothetical protein BSKO_08363 [Bryopsis sp. KO-2023]|nr:hypothetical protein BSKO_08363 [Bryopsis sp. KO-2023]